MPKFSQIVGMVHPFVAFIYVAFMQKTAGNRDRTLTGYLPVGTRSDHSKLAYLLCFAVRGFEAHKRAIMKVWNY